MPLGEAMTEHIYQPVTNPGDVVFFSEATVHGCLPWNAEHQRRVVLYRFAPSNCAYGRTYHPAWQVFLSLINVHTPICRNTPLLLPPTNVQRSAPTAIAFGQTRAPYSDTMHVYICQHALTK